MKKIKTAAVLWLLILSVHFGLGFGCPSPEREGAKTKETESQKREAREPARASVLFFNDVHGHLSPFTISRDGETVEVGGIARMAAEIKRIRAENKRRGVPTFLLVAGDALQGTPMSTVFQGKPDFECMNAMKVDAMTIGNHEFDFGLDNFLGLQKLAAFPFLSANVVWKDTGEPIASRSVSLELEKGLYLTVIGVTTSHLLETTKPSNVEKLAVIEPIASMREAYEEAVKKGPVILLSHSRARTDEAIARAFPDLAAIIGGHDQILINPSKKVGEVPVFQAFEKGKYLGRLELEIDRDSGRAAVASYEYVPITSAIEPDPQIEGIVESYRSRLDDEFKEVIGEALVFMDGERERIRYEETNLGDFATDVMREYTGADLALLNAGSLRSSLAAGPITVEDVFKTMPYANEVVIAELTGDEIMTALTRAVMGTREDEDGGFLHVSGISFVIEGKKPTEVKFGAYLKPLEAEKKYAVAITDFMADGGDGYKVFMGKTSYKTGSPLRELLVDRIKAQGKIEAKTEGRITRAEP